jgi:hypothetical protein
MDKRALEKKLREIHKATCNLVDERYFESLYKDATDHIAWSRLHGIAYSYGCDLDYIALMDQCCIAATRIFLGDKC